MFSSKQLRSLIIPLIIEQILGAAIGIADTVMVSSVGEGAVSGVSLVDMVTVFIQNLFYGFSTGGAVIASQYLGAKHFKGARRSAGQLILLLASSGIVLCSLCLLFRSSILTLLFRKAESDVMSNALTYFTITAVSYPFIAMFSSFSALFRSMEQTKIAMTASLVVNVINVVGNAILIFGFNMGVEGAAISTVFARFCAMVFLILRFFLRDSQLHPSKGDFRPDSHMLRKILFIGGPSSIENSMFQIGKLLLAGFITSFGTVHITANAVANSIACFGIIPGEGMTHATITVVGHCIGAGEDEEAIYNSKRMLKISYVMCLITNILVMATLPLTILMFSVSDEARKLAVTLVMLQCICAIPLWPVSFVTPCALRAGGDAKFTLSSSLISMWVFRVLLGYILGHVFGMGVIGVWTAMIIDWVFRSIMFIIRFKSRKWMKHRLIED